jgi:hypothetical protein
MYGSCTTFAPRAMSAKVKGFMQFNNWYQDFTPVYVEN